MRFMMFVCDDGPVDAAPEEFDPSRWVAEHDASGARTDGDRLVEAHRAKVVRVRDGEIHVVDGPRVPGVSQIAGFDILECGSLEEAIAVAADHPIAKLGAIEVRAFWDWTAS